MMNKHQSLNTSLLPFLVIYRNGWVIVTFRPRQTFMLILTMIRKRESANTIGGILLIAGQDKTKTAKPNEGLDASEIIPLQHSSIAVDSALAQQ